MNSINFQDFFGLFASAITILTAIVALVRYIVKKQSNSPKNHSSKSIVGYILLPVFLIILGAMIGLWYYGVAISIWLYVTFAISLVSIFWISTIAYLSFNKKEILQPEWVWKLIFYKIPKFRATLKSKINILILYANDCV